MSEQARLMFTGKEAQRTGARIQILGDRMAIIRL